VSTAASSVLGLFFTSAIVALLLII
jgi:hypothetical protein